MTISKDKYSINQELKIQKEIRLAEDDLVLWIQAAFDNSKYDDLEESQFRNLVKVADSSESAEVIKNFIRYQVGRDKKWGRGENSLAERIILDIGAYVKTEKPNLKEGNLIKLAKNIAEKTKSSDIKTIWVELIRRYLGYGSRYLTYLNKIKSKTNKSKKD